MLGALLWICASYGKYVQTKRKSILQRCPPAAGTYDTAALARSSRNLHPDTHKDAKVVSCWDSSAKREVASSSLRLPQVQQTALHIQRGARGPARRKQREAQ